MTPPPGNCQCDVYPDRPCGAAITQEDLLCDSCRAVRASEVALQCTSFQVSEDFSFHWGFGFANSPPRLRAYRSPGRVVTDKSEAELEAENRVLREQVASLEKVIERLARPLVHLAPAPGYAPYPWPGGWYGTQVTCGNVNGGADLDENYGLAGSSLSFT